MYLSHLLNIIFENRRKQDLVANYIYWRIEWSTYHFHVVDLGKTSHKNVYVDKGRRI